MRTTKIIILIMDMLIILAGANMMLFFTFEKKLPIMLSLMLLTAISFVIYYHLKQ